MKISCGGFELDNETLIEEDGVLKVAGSGQFIIGITVEHPYNAVSETAEISSTFEQIEEAFRKQQALVVQFDTDASPSNASYVIIPLKFTDWQNGELKDFQFQAFDMISGQFGLHTVTILKNGSGDTVCNYGWTNIN